MAASCDGVMECDSIVLLSEGVGQQTSSVNSEGTLQFEFPPNTKPASVKIGPHELALTPWLKQAVRGSVHPPSEVTSTGAAEKLYKKYVAGQIERLLEGENVVITSFGDEKTQKVPLVFGDAKSSKGMLHCFYEELFKAKELEGHQVTVSAYAYNPATDKVTDLISTGESEPYMKDADAKRAGSDVTGLQSAFVNSYDGAKVEVDHMKASIQRIREEEVARVDKRAEEMSLKSKRSTEDGDDVVDLDDFVHASSPLRKPKGEGVSSYIPEPFYDEVLVVNTVIHTGDTDVLKDRTSTQWCTATFLLLPDNSRPEAVGALSQNDVKRYEKVQRLVCSVLAILMAIRLKRRRVPFLAHKWTSTLRFAYRQTGEKEDETRIIKNASFRKEATKGDDGSPKAKKAKEAQPTRSIVFMNLSSKGEVILENFHSFTCAKRLVEMGTSVTGMFTRHLAIEQAQMDREIASLMLQLEVAKQVHSYRPMLFGVTTKGGADKSIKEREEAALNKKKEQIEAQAEERRVRIHSAAQHIADRNIHEEMSRLAQVQQQHDDKKAQHTKANAELRKWKNMSTDHLVREINKEADGLRLAEKKVAAQESLAKRLHSDKEAAERGLTDMHAQMKDNQRKALQELEAKKNSARLYIEKRQQLAYDHIEEMRAELEYAGTMVLDKAEALLKISSSKTNAFQGTEAADEARLIRDNLASSIQGLHGLLPRILPSNAPGDEQKRRIEAVRGKIISNSTHELLSLRAEMCDSAIPLPTAVGAEAQRREGPLVSLHVTILGVTGLVKRKNNKFSVAVHQRGGGIAETARVPMREATGVVEWEHLVRIPHRLPADRKKLSETPSFATFALTEFLPDGSFSESLPFDVDLNAFACKPVANYHIVPGKASDVAISIRVATKKMKRKEVLLNPLHTLQTLKETKRTDDYGPSSDEGE
eukprot:TRINITY_DN8181_c0_g1_i1.p1 TRINITY_DN8181_c0_g1~~TRINITY_DN8181_c0_g1_i1.p1  ORF type:complete len:931 (+),score=401.79 TRINITY_DN8181_c0_g1_i1:519-3311(+)